MRPQNGADGVGGLFIPASDNTAYHPQVSLACRGACACSVNKLLLQAYTEDKIPQEALVAQLKAREQEVLRWKAMYDAVARKQQEQEREFEHVGRPLFKSLPLITSYMPLFVGGLDARSPAIQRTGAQSQGRVAAAAA